MLRCAAIKQPASAQPAIHMHQVRESEKIVAKHGEHVIDKNPITVADQQSCMDLCALVFGNMGIHGFSTSQVRCSQLDMFDECERILLSFWDWKRLLSHIKNIYLSANACADWMEFEFMQFVMTLDLICANISNKRLEQRNTCH